MDMKKYILSAVAMMAIMPMAAQETYENAKLTGDDLNGTARYVGMGGAMEALGADLSTISSNPAGMGLFRHSTVSGSAGLIFQSADRGAKGDKTNASFDQLGIVYSIRSGRNSYLNLAYNYHKSKNFNYILAAANRLNGASQNKQTSQKWYNGAFDTNNDNLSTVDHFYLNNFLGRTDDEGKTYYDGWVDANSFRLNREHEGWIADHDFSVSGNINDRVYLGVTFGIKDVNYKHYGEYSEELVDGARVGITDDREVDGTGFDVKAGIIVRPVEESPFRIGAYVHTPTWYDLTTKNTTRYYDSSLGSAAVESNRERYDYRVVTPWVFGFSLGHTVGNYLALGATVEYTDYSSTKTRYEDLALYDPIYGDVYKDSSNDNVMNRHTDNTLKGVATVKLGAEYKPIPNLALRAGYNYVSPKYKSSGEKATYEYSQEYTANDPIGIYYTSTTDFTNWKGTNRVTFGIGYQIDRWNIDLAYQYSAQKGDFRPFGTYIEDTPNSEGIVDHSQDNIPSVTSVKNNRSQLLMTLSYHF